MKPGGHNDPLISVQSVVHLSSSIYGVGRAQFDHPIIIYSAFHNFHRAGHVRSESRKCKGGGCINDYIEYTVHY